MIKYNNMTKKEHCTPQYRKVRNKTTQNKVQQNVLYILYNWTQLKNNTKRVKTIYYRIVLLNSIQNNTIQYKKK
mgnify:CR=1 FL=1